MKINIRELEAFRAVMELGSVTEAARLLGVTQPAVSKMLQHAEARLGIRLFARERGRLIPTAEAHVLLPDLTNAFAAVDHVEQVVEDLRSARGGLLRIAAVPSLSTSLVPAAVESFRRDRPAVTIALRALSLREISRQATEHQLDLGLVLGAPEDPRLAIRDICASRLICLLPAGHPLGGKALIRPVDLAGIPVIRLAQQRPVGLMVDRLFAEAGIEPVTAVEISQSANALPLVRAGVGPALLEGFAMIGQEDADMVVRPFGPGAPVTARLLQPRHQPLSRLAQAFAEALSDAVAALVAAGVVAPAGYTGATDSVPPAF